MSNLIPTTFNEVMKPVGIGVCSGFGFFAYDLYTCMTTGKIPASTTRILNYPYYHVLEHSSIIMITLKSEAIYRAIVHRSIGWVSTQIFEEKEISIGNYKISIASLITTIFSGLFFGIHYYKELSSNELMKTIFFGTMLGLLQEKYGLLSALSAHCVVNHFSYEGFKSIIIQDAAKKFFAALASPQSVST